VAIRGAALAAALGRSSRAARRGAHLPCAQPACARAPRMSAGDGGGLAAWSGVARWAESARKVVAEQAQGAYEQVQKGAGDLELGGALGEGSQQWVGWAKGAADRARLGLAQAAEKANAADLGSVVGKVTENASKAARPPCRARTGG
ncbi:unnamed protein product, partial [Prorocentrum cordatum]